MPLLSTLVCLALLSGDPQEGDWPQWCGSDQKNMASSARNLPGDFVPGEKKSDGSGVDLKTTRNVRWVARLGTETYCTPTVGSGRVLVGTNDRNLSDPRCEPTGGGLVLCLDEKTGRRLWRLIVPKLESDHQSTKYDDMSLGVCSSAAIEGNRAYMVTNRCDVLCLDLAGQSNGNDGPFREEGQYMAGPGKPALKVDPGDADVIWHYDMFNQQMVWPHDAASASVLIGGDYLYCCTANGVNGEDPSPFPLAASLIVLDKRTGGLVARDDEKIGQRVFHGQWSSPSLGTVDGRALVFFGAGDGTCYAFEAITAATAGDDRKPTILKKVWSFQCNPPEHRFRAGKPIPYWDGDKRNKRGNNDDGKYVGPNEIIATPVFYKNRVYVATGQDPVHGRGKGTLNCIDATGRGDISETGKIWSYDKLDRSLSTVSIADGLLYIADRPGVLHCLNADTGECYWTYDTRAEVWGSTLVADGKVYLPTRKSLCVFAAGKSRNSPKQIKLGSPVWASPIAAHDTLFVASLKYLWAVQSPGGTMLTALPLPAIRTAAR